MPEYSQWFLIMAFIRKWIRWFVSKIQISMFCCAGWHGCSPNQKIHSTAQKLCSCQSSFCSRLPSILQHKCFRLSLPPFCKCLKSILFNPGFPSLGRECLWWVSLEKLVKIRIHPLGPCVPWSFNWSLPVHGVQALLDHLQGAPRHGALVHHRLLQDEVIMCCRSSSEGECARGPVSPPDEDKVRRTGLPRRWTA